MYDYVHNKYQRRCYAKKCHVSVVCFQEAEAWTLINIKRSTSVPVTNAFVFHTRARYKMLTSSINGLRLCSSLRQYLPHHRCVRWHPVWHRFIHLIIISWSLRSRHISAPGMQHCNGLRRLAFRWNVLYPDCWWNCANLRSSVLSTYVINLQPMFARATAIYNLGQRLHTVTAAPRPTQPSTLHGMLKWVSVSGLSNMQ